MGHVKTKYRSLRRLVKEIIHYEGQPFPAELRNWMDVAIDKSDNRTEELLQKEKMYWEVYPLREPELRMVTEKYKRWL